MEVFQETYGGIPPTTDGIENGLWRTLPAPPANTDAFATSSTGAIMAPPVPEGGGRRGRRADPDGHPEGDPPGGLVEDAFTEAAKAVQDEIDKG